MASPAVLSVRIVTDGKDGRRGLDDVSKGVGNLDKNLKSVQSPMDRVKGLLSGVGKFAVGAAKTVAGVTLAVGALALKGGIDKSLQIEQATAKMKGLKHSTETIEKVMGNALSAVKGTAFGMGDAANIASTALASGIKPGAEMSRYLTMVADAAATAQVPLGEMGQIMGKVTNSGKVTNEVLTQFGDRGVGALQMLAEHYGVTAGEMTDMVSKGKVDAATFQKVLEKNIGGAAKATGDTTTGAFANMKSALANFGIVLGGPFFPLFKLIFNQIQKILEGLTDRLKPVSDAFAKTFQGKAIPIISEFATKTLGFLDEIIGGFRAFANAWRENNGDITSSGFPGFMERVANGARVVQGVFKQLDFSSMSGFIASLSGAGSTAGASLGSIGTSLQTLKPALDAFMAQLPNIGGAVVKLGGVSLGLLTKGLEFLANHVDTIIKFMPAIVAGFVAWRVASSAMSAAQTKTNALAVAAIPLTTVNNVLRLVAIRQEGQLAAATTASAAATNMSLGAMIRQKAAMVASTAAMVAQKAAMAVATAAQWLFNAAMSANPVMLIVLAIAALVAGVILAYNKIGWFRDFVDAAFKFIGEAVTNVVDWFKSAWSIAVLGVSLLIQSWQAKFAVVVAAIRLVVAGVVNFFTSAWSGAVAAGAGFVIGFQTKVAGVFAGIRSTIDNVVSVVRDTLGSAFQSAASLAQGAMDRITGAIQGVISWIQDAIGWIGSLFGKANSGGGGGGGGGGATSYARGPGGGPDFPGGATGFMLRPAAFGASSSAPAAQITNINVTVNVPLGGDPVAVGRELEKTLNKYYRATGKTGGFR